MRRHTISFKNAFTGIYTAARTQANIRIHLLATIIVLLAGAYFQVSLTEGLILMLTIASVFVAEMFNTAIEFLADAVTRKDNEFIRHAKDVAAGAVLFSAILALAVGFLIFYPKINCQMFVNCKL
ncbi:diacylglycerol kinase family protein [Patescibacteria group bacterium]|nr:diacylglycerol kinase family protein [Patescibacteria group bacterium]